MKAARLPFLVDGLQTVEASVFCDKNKASLVKGRWPSEARSEGFAVRCYDFALVFGEFVIFYRESPSHGFAVPAPFDKGAFFPYL